MIHRFADCELDEDRHEFRRSGRLLPLEPQVFDLLCLFLRAPGALVTRDQIVAEIWQNRIVSEAAISSRINALRRALGDTGKAQAVLATVPRRGFRLMAEVTTERAPASSPLPKPAPQRIRFARSRDGTALAWTTTGSGPPLLRAGHFLTHLEYDWQSPIWHPFLDHLGRHFSVTRYDQRTTGLSAEANGPVTLDTLVQDLEAVADAAGLDRFPVLAASQGVPVSIAFAARHPDRITRLVLYGGYAQGRALRQTPEDRDRADAILTLIREGWGRRSVAFATAFAALYAPDADHAQIEDLVRLQLASATPEAAVNLRRAIDGFDVTAMLAEVRCPTLVLHGRDDAVQPLEQSRLIAARIPGAEFHLLESRNHIPLRQDPAWQDLMARAIDFLSEP